MVLASKLVSAPIIAEGALEIAATLMNNELILLSGPKTKFHFLLSYKES